MSECPPMAVLQYWDIANYQYFWRFKAERLLKPMTQLQSSQADVALEYLDKSANHCIVVKPKLE